MTRSSPPLAECVPLTNICSHRERSSLQLRGQLVSFIRRQAVMRQIEDRHAEIVSALPRYKIFVRLSPAVGLASKVPTLPAHPYQAHLPYQPYLPKQCLHR